MVQFNSLKPLDNLGRVKLKLTGGQSIDLDALETVLTGALNECGMPFALFKDQIVSGGLFSRSYEDCLCLKNPEHERDYFQYCVRLQQAGNTAFVSLYYFGESTLTGQKNKETERSNSGSLGKMMLGAIFKADQQAYDTEYQYYEIVEDAIREALGVG